MPKPVHLVSVRVISRKGARGEDWEALRLLGVEKFIRRGLKSRLSFNLLMAASPDAAITTHPEFARRVLRLLKILIKIYLGDGPSVLGSQMENIVMSMTRPEPARDGPRKEAVELVTFDKRYMVRLFSLGSLCQGSR